MKKKILIVCSVLLAIVLVAAGTFEYYMKPKYVTPLVLAVEEFLLEDEETLDLLIQEYENSLIEDDNLANETVNTNEKEQIVGTTEVIDKVETDTETENIEAQPEELKKPKKKDKGKIVAGGKTMEELQKEVAPNDLKAGVSIASKIDAGHLLSLSKGGFTPENKKKASQHLHSRLSSGEIAQLKGLVGKYAYLLK